MQEQETQKAIAAAEADHCKAREAAAADTPACWPNSSREVGRLVVQTTATVTGKILTPEDQQRLAEETAASWPLESSRRAPEPRPEDHQTSPARSERTLPRCLVNGLLDEDQVRQAVQQVIAAKPRGYLAILSHFQRLVKLDLDAARRASKAPVPLARTAAGFDAGEP